MTGGRDVDFGDAAQQEKLKGVFRSFLRNGGEQALLNPRILSSVAMLALLLQGCAFLGGGTPALDTYELSAPTPKDGPRHPRLQVLIVEPSALKALDGQNIVVRPAPGVIEYLKGAQWADRLPRVVQARLADAFQKSGRFGGVGKPGEGLAIDYRVIVDIRAFDVMVGQDNQANVVLFVRVLNDRNGEVKASRTFQTSAPVSGSGNDSYVAALNTAFGQAASEIVRWSASVI